MSEKRENIHTALIVTPIAAAFYYVVFGPHDVYLPITANHFWAGLVTLPAVLTSVSYSILTGAFVGILLLVVYCEATSKKKDPEFAMMAVFPGFLLMSPMCSSAWYSGVFLGPLLGCLIALFTGIFLWVRKASENSEKPTTLRS